MSSIWKHPNSRFWTACFTGMVGGTSRQLKRSTKTSDRKLARRMADELEEAAQGRRTTVQVEAFVNGVSDLRVRAAAFDSFDAVLRQTGGNGLRSDSVRTYCETWLGRNRAEVAHATFIKYEKVISGFLDQIGKKANGPMSSLTIKDFYSFRDSEATRISRSSCNLSFKIVRMVFNAAEAEGVVMRNEAKHVRMLKADTDTEGRRAFTLPELERILKESDAEWRSMILFSLYGGGIRLGDVALLRWNQIDLDTREFWYRAKKTGRIVRLPICGALLELISALPVTDVTDAPVHPRACETLQAQGGRVGTLSAQFRKILVNAGLVEAKSHQGTGRAEGRSGKRNSGSLSFHCLRHTAVSLLKRAGVGEAVAMDLAGHESPEISRHYTSIDTESKRTALEKLPDLLS